MNENDENGRNCFQTTQVSDSQIFSWIIKKFFAIFVDWERNQKRIEFIWN